MLRRGLELSPVHSVLVERSVIGWKEFELEVMRDGADNVVIVCSIENLDPMGVHTGDSITVAPAMTLTDREYQVMRDSAIRIIREIGVAAGGCNIQFAVDPATGEQLVIEMNPRVSRSSALASKATGFPIARIGTKVAVGYRLDELPNDITTHHAGFLRAGARLRGREDPALRLREVPHRRPDAHDPDEVGRRGDGDRPHVQGGVPEGIPRAGGRPLGWDASDATPADDRLEDDSLESARSRSGRPRRSGSSRSSARYEGGSVDAIAERSGIDPWFLHQLRELVEAEDEWTADGPTDRRTQRRGASLAPAKDEAARASRPAARRPARDKRVARSARCAIGSASARPTRRWTPAPASSPRPRPISTRPTTRRTRRGRVGDRTVVILGSGPNRIGQGVEFDYCCVPRGAGVPGDGFPTVMVNSNPETVSTDFDISDVLYFEPLTLEDVLEIVHVERPYGRRGAARRPDAAPSWRGRWRRKASASSAPRPTPSTWRRTAAASRRSPASSAWPQPPSGIAYSVDEAVAVAGRIGYPVLVRPSYVLGGRAMEIVYDDGVAPRATSPRAARVAPEHPVLIDRFLEDAFEADVDAICDGTRCVIGGVMQHIEDAGIHSGDSACVLPPYLITEPQVEEMRRHTRAFAERSAWSA